MARVSLKGKGLNVFLVVFSLLVLVGAAYYLGTGHIALFSSGAKEVGESTPVPTSKPTARPTVKPTAVPTKAPAGSCATGHRCTGTKTVDILDGCSTLNPNTGAPRYPCYQHSHPYTATCNSSCKYDLMVRQILCNTKSCTEYSGAEIAGNCCV